MNLDDRVLKGVSADLRSLPAGALRHRLRRGIAHRIFVSIFSQNSRLL
ncbi:MAG: hypothetical protein RMY36_014835 [Nostoc sp. SerVER01]|nr:hypothetical protein [Nostoc sp. SerVER01]MDZ8079281.1 hypothetical protein [Nostoc sp. DcaGUA01]